MKHLILNVWGKSHPITFRLDTYAQNGNLYVGMVTHEDGYPVPWSDLTVNLGVKCKENCAYIDINNNGSVIIEWLMAHGLGHLTGNLRTSGWCDYPEFEFNMNALKELA